MKARIALVIFVGMAIPTGATAKQGPSQKPPAELVNALNAMAPTPNSAAPQSKQAKAEHDQGDEHASPRAKDVVCSKNTPAAERSAICPQPVSP